MSIFKNLGSISANLQDRAHATKIFVDGNYELAPKYNFLYYVHIESAVYDKSKELGMLVKSAQLPRFNIDLKKNNLYNKTGWTQTKINYEPVTITFHDDNADFVRDFWREYFKYYYQDSKNPETTFGSMITSKYSDTRISNAWGYTQQQYEPFLKKITIYSLHKKEFSSYSLMNPVIKSFQHGEHQYSASSEGMQNSITVEYESVLYSQGKVHSDSIPGFLELRYDHQPSPLTPIGGGTASITGQGGLLETISQVGDDISQGKVGIGTIFKGIQGIRNASSMDIKNAAITEIIGIGKDILRGNDITKKIFIPTMSNISDKVGNALNLGLNNKANWLVNASNIGALARSGISRINQEVTDATSRLTKSFPKGISDKLPGIGSIASLLPFSALNVESNYNELMLPSVNAESTLEFVSKNAEVAQSSEIKLSSNQISMNDPQIKTTLNYNLNIIKQNKTKILIEINFLKEQNQIAQDTITSLISKRKSLLEEHEEFRNTLLINQLTLLIEQQEEFMNRNFNTINDKNLMIVQLDENINFINLKLSSLI